MSSTKGEARLAVRVTPGAKRNSVAGFQDGTWRIKIAAPPIEGKANHELVSYLSEILNVRRSCFQLIKGESNRDKLLSVKGISPEDIAARLSSELRG